MRTPRNPEMLNPAGVSITELNQRTSAVLARAKRGEQVAITERGKVVATLVPAEPHPLAHLVAEGKLHPPTRMTAFRTAGGFS